MGRGGRASRSLAGDALEQLAARPGAEPGSEPSEADDVVLTHRELADYMLAVLDGVIGDDAAAR